MKKQILLAGALCASMLASAENIDVKSFRYAGPYVVQQPYLVDSVDVNSKSRRPATRKKVLRATCCAAMTFPSASSWTANGGKAFPKTLTF